MKIYKYSIPFDRKYHSFRMPEGKIIHIDVQEDFCFWVLHNNFENIFQREFRLYATGEDISSDEKYIGSCQCGTKVPSLPFLVLHLFEKEPS